MENNVGDRQITLAESREQIRLDRFHQRQLTCIQPGGDLVAGVLEVDETNAVGVRRGKGQRVASTEVVLHGQPPHHVRKRTADRDAMVGRRCR